MDSESHEKDITDVAAILADTHLEQGATTQSDASTNATVKGDDQKPPVRQQSTSVASDTQSTSARTGPRWLLFGRQIKQLAEQHHEDQGEIRELREDLNKSQEALENMKRELKDKKKELEDTTDELDVTNELLERVRNELKELYADQRKRKKKHGREGKSGPTPDVSFSSGCPLDGSSMMNVHSTRTFPIGPEGSTRPVTLGYMEVDQVPYFARSGSHGYTVHGFIDAKFWAERAQSIFENLDLEKDRSWFTHVEPQLMALFVTHIMEEQGNGWKDFGSGCAKSAEGIIRTPGDVQIFVSRTICNSCIELVGVMNETAKQYGVEFCIWHQA